MSHQKLLEISKKLGLPVKKLEDMFFLLKNGDAVDNNDLLRRLGISKNVLNKAKEKLSGLLKPVSSTTQLSEAGLRVVQEIVGSNHLVEEHLWEFLKDNHYKAVLKLLEKHEDKRPSPDRNYDQFTATPETTALRASLLNFFADIRGKRLLFLGDDDFNSLAVASFGSAKSIDVLDVDKRILEAIKSISETESLSVGTTRNDLRQRLPGQLLRKFDVVFTDPPYTTNGIKLFLSRAIQALDPKNHAARVYVCYGNSDGAKERYLPIQQLFVDSGLITKWVFSGFNRYFGAESIGSSSTLLIGEVTPKTKPLVKATFNEEIYTNN